MYSAFQDEILKVSNPYRTLMVAPPHMTDLNNVTKENLRET